LPRGARGSRRRSRAQATQPIGSEAHSEGPLSNILLRVLICRPPAALSLASIVPSLLTDKLL
jgi:hypothetical protein